MTRSSTRGRAGIKPGVVQLRSRNTRRKWQDCDVANENAAAVAAGGMAVGFRSLDGLRLRGTFVKPPDRASGVAVLVHGGGVTRDEGGFFTRLAAGLAGAGVASLRFDLRGQGQSDGRQQDLTLASVANDILAAIAHLIDRVGSASPVNLIGTSFAGGI